ncbi:MAG: hypothetical protein F6K58_32525 [Symploca sp. SIO2E9]|nr:hypothetical protein [Symploca sp. SIO2E9]
MPVVSDYTVIQRNVVRVTPANPLTKTFNTGGRRGSGDVFMTFSIRSLGEPNDVPVQVNNLTIGRLENYHGMDARNWFTQTIVFSASVLRNGDNNLEIEVNTGDLILDNIIVHFQQSA